MQLALTNAQPALTHMQLALTRVQPALTHMQLALTRVQPALTHAQLALTRVQPALMRRSAPALARVYAMPRINPEQLRTFAEDGYIVLPNVVSSALIDAARNDIADRVARQPPSPGHRGPHFYFVMNDAHASPGLPPALTAPLFESDAAELARSLMGPAPFEPLDHVQISRNLPPFPHRPGGPHIDGLNPPAPDGTPHTFTLLAGVFLTDQSREDAGNLWVWPGSHKQTAAYLREHGPDALVASSPYPPIDLGTPRQVTAHAGDLVLAHYLLGHNIDGNVSDTVREVLYYRLKHKGHRARWREAVQNPLLELDSVRAALR